MRREHSPAKSINLSVCRFAVVAVGQRGGTGSTTAKRNTITAENHVKPRNAISKRHGNAVYLFMFYSWMPLVALGDERLLGPTHHKLPR